MAREIGNGVANESKKSTGLTKTSFAIWDGRALSSYACSISPILVRRQARKRRPMACGRFIWPRKKATPLNHFRRKARQFRAFRHCHEANNGEAECLFAPG